MLNASPNERLADMKPSSQLSPRFPILTLGPSIVSHQHCLEQLLTLSEQRNDRGSYLSSAENISSMRDKDEPESDFHDDRSSWTKTLDAASVPVTALMESAPPELGDSLTNKVASALQTAIDHSQALFNSQDMEERLRKARAYPGSKDSGHEGHLRQIDEEVLSRCTEIKQRTVVGSCITGFSGALGQLADIPAFYFYAVHSLQEIAICYGFDPRQEREQKFLLQLLRIGHAPGKTNRKKQIAELDRLDIDSSLATLPELSYALTGKGMYILARQLLKALLRRKAVAMIPVLGAVVNAGINNHLMSAILDTAQKSYRQRFLRRAELIASDQV